MCWGSLLPTAVTTLKSTAVNNSLRGLRSFAELLLVPKMKLRTFQVMDLCVLDCSPWQILPLRLDGTCRTSAVEAIYPKMPSHKAYEVLLHMFAPGHVADPQWSYHAGFLRMWPSILEGRLSKGSPSLIRLSHAEPGHNHFWFKEEGLHLPHDCG